MTLAKLIQSGRYKVFATITVLFIISNLSMIFYSIFTKNMTTSSAPWMTSTFYVIMLGCENIGHWMFSYEYFNMARIIPFVLNGVAPPESLVKSNKVQYWFWFILNIVVIVLLGVSSYFFDRFYRDKESQK